MTAQVAVDPDEIRQIPSRRFVPRPIQNLNLDSPVPHSVNAIAAKLTTLCGSICQC